MGVGAGFCMYDVVVKSSRSLSHLVMSSCLFSSLPDISFLKCKHGTQKTDRQTDRQTDTRLTASFLGRPE